MNALLRNISENASEDLRNLIEEGAEDILKAIHKTEEEAQANDAKPKFALGFKITVDFDAASYSCDLSWSLKQTLGTTHTIDDPNQPPLPSIGESVKGFAKTITKGGTTMTLKTGGKSVTITPEKAAAAVKRIEKAEREGKF